MDAITEFAVKCEREYNESRFYFFPRGPLIEFLSQKTGMLEGEIEEMLDEFDAKLPAKE